MNGKGIHITSKVLGVILIVLCIAVIAIRNKNIQTKIIRLIEDKIESTLGASISFSSISVSAYGSLLLQDFLVKDPTPYTEDAYNKGYAPTDTIFYAKNISATFTIKGILSKEGLHLGRVNVDNGGLFLVNEPYHLSGRYLNLEAVLGPKKIIEPDYVASPGPNIFDIKKVKVENFRFRLINFSPPLDSLKTPVKHEVGINFDDIDLIANLRAHNLKMAGGIMSGVLDHCDAIEKNGFILDHMSGSAEVGLGRTYVEDFTIQSGPSDIRFKSYSLSYKNVLAFNDFVNQVNMRGDFKPSRVALCTLNEFCALNIGDNSMIFDISRGIVYGPVNQIKVDRLSFKEINSKISGRLEGGASSIIPDVSQMHLSVKAESLAFNTKQLSQLLNSILKPGSQTIDLKDLAPWAIFTSQIECDGRLDDLNLSSSISSPIGSLQLGGQLNNLLDTKSPVSINAHLCTQELALNDILNTDILGRVNAEGAAKLILNSSATVRIDSLVIPKIQALGRDFQNLRLAGAMDDNTVDLRFSSADESFSSDIIALVDLKAFDGVQRLKLAAEISKADLNALGMKRELEAPIVSGHIYSNLIKSDRLILGDALISKIHLSGDNIEHDVDDISLKAFQRDGEQFYYFDSPFVDLTYNGSHGASVFINDILDLSLRKHLSPLLSKSERERITNQENPKKDSLAHYSLGLDFHDSRLLMSYLMPKLYVADSTRLWLNLDAGQLKGELNSPRLAFGRNFARGLSLQIDNRNDSLSAKLNTEELHAGSLRVNNPKAQASVLDNAFLLKAELSGISGSNSGGLVQLEGSLLRNEEDSLVLKARPIDSYLQAGNDKWLFNKSELCFVGNDIHIDSLGIFCGDQSLIVDGGLSRIHRDSLCMSLNSLDLRLIELFLVNKASIGGISTGEVFISSPTNSELGMLLNFDCDSLSIGGNPLGKFSIKSHWDETDKSIKLSLNNSTKLNALGSYKPKGKEIKLNAKFDDFRLDALAPLFPTVLSESGGGISGRISAESQANGLSLKSEDLMLNDAFIRVNYTGVPYTLNGPVHIDDSGIYLDNLSVVDKDGGKGNLSGALKHQNFKDLRLEAQAKLNNLQVISLEEQENSIFYGNLKASGEASISGPFNRLIVDARVSTEGDGDIHVPLSGALTSTRSNLLVFTESYSAPDPYEEMLKAYELSEKKEYSDFIARGSLKLNPGLKAILEIDKSTGNVINISGEGTIDLDLQPSKGIVNLNGEYNIDNGNYHFVLPGILEKDFEIRDNSSLKFSGPLMESQIDIEAVHPVRTSLNTLLADSTIVNSRRLVECVLQIGNKLSSPELGFSIEIPDLDPTTKSKVDGALNTEDKVQRQFVVLLLAGTFLPSEQSGVFNGSNILYSNIGELVSSQINSILQKLDIPVDIGLGYQQQNSGNDIFDVAISTQLFNNRLVVNGTVGNRNNKYGGGEQNVVGDLDIELKLDKAGKYRLNAFSHSADDHSNYLDNSQRNGIGISFQQEFNKLKELFLSIFSRSYRQGLNSEFKSEENLKIIDIDE